VKLVPALSRIYNTAPTCQYSTLPVANAIDGHCGTRCIHTCLCDSNKTLRSVSLIHGQYNVKQIYNRGAESSKGDGWSRDDDGSFVRDTSGPLFPRAHIGRPKHNEGQLKRSRGEGQGVGGGGGRCRPPWPQTHWALPFVAGALSYRQCQVCHSTRLRSHGSLAVSAKDVPLTPTNMHVSNLCASETMVIV
jgi:hypothetical protein